MFWKQRFLEDMHDVYENGYGNGYDNGHKKTIIELYRKEIITIEIVMSELNMTKEEIEEEMSELPNSSTTRSSSCSVHHATEVPTGS